MQNSKSANLEIGVKSRIISIAAIFFITFFWSSLFAVQGIDLHHDGIMFFPALRVAAGDVIFRDIFCQYGWLTPLVQGGALAVFGGELIVLKILNSLVYAGAAVLLFLNWQSHLRSFFRWIPVLLFWILLPDAVATAHIWSSVLALFFTLAGTLAVQKYYTSGKWYFAFAGGIFTALTFLSRHPCGVVMLIAFVTVFTLEVWMATVTQERGKVLKNGLLSCLAGIAAGLMPFIFYLYFGNCFDEWIFQCFTQIFGFVRQRGGSWDLSHLATSLMPFYRKEAWLLEMFFAFLPMFLLGYLLITVRKAHTDREIWHRSLPLLLLIVVGLGSWHQYYPVPCVRHLFWGGVPMFGFFALALQDAFAVKDSLRKIRVIFGILLIAVLFVPICGLRCYGAANRLTTMNIREKSSCGGIRGMLLARHERKFLKALFNGIDRCEKKFRDRGVANFTEDMLFSAILPDCGFRYRQVCNLRNVYPDFKQKFFEFVSDKRPLILSDENVFIPNYFTVGKYMFWDKEYYLLCPRENR